MPVSTPDLELSGHRQRIALHTSFVSVSRESRAISIAPPPCPLLCMPASSAFVLDADELSDIDADAGVSLAIVHSEQERFARLASRLTHDVRAFCHVDEQPSAAV